MEGLESGNTTSPLDIILNYRPFDLRKDEYVAILSILTFFSVLAMFTQMRRLKDKKKSEEIVRLVTGTSSYYAPPIGSTLMRYGHDLTSMAKTSKLDTIVGRDPEVEKVLQIFSRRSKNNPVLIGHSGVGKTSVLHALAQKIVDGDIPENFKKTRVAVLDSNRLIAGNKAHYDFEQRLRGVVDDIEGHVIVFIDELQVLLQMGKNESNGGGNVLKPYLANGTLHFVGAMTVTNYNKFVETDPTLSRHFQPIMVDEPSVEQTVEILKTLKPRLERHHHVTLSDDSMVTACTYSARFMSELFLPEKAIDLIDMAAAQVSLRLDTQPESIKSLAKSISLLKAETEILKQDTCNSSLVAKNEAEIKTKQTSLENLTKGWSDSRTTKESHKSLLKKIEEAKGELVLAESANNAIIILEVKSKLSNLESLLNATPTDNNTARTVTSSDVAAAVSVLTGIPMTSLMAAECDRVLNLEKALMDKIIGQDEAVQSISNAIRISRAGLHAYGRPLGSFLFLGPTGVGKTQLCRVLAQELFNDANAMVRIDMSEYMEKFSVSRLIGAPPGYVGYEEGGTLTEAVRRCPSSLILFDEFEKAHREVSNLLLQLLDAGHLTDSKGRKVDFSNTMVVMTSNLGSDILSGLPEKHDTAQARDKVMDIVKSNFAPEFLNRIDEIIIFNRLNRKNIDRIVDIELKNIVKMLSNRDIALALTDEARAWIADKGYDSVYGARPLRRVIQRWLLNPMASLLLSGVVTNGCEVLVDVALDQLRVTKKK